MSENKTASVPIIGFLGVAFIVLKLCHVIDWSWWWVTAPFWGGLALVLAMMLVGGAILGLATLIVAFFENKR